MKKILSLFAFLILNSSYAQDLRLWYLQPAAKWTEALPLGNGRLAGMVFGKTSTEQIQLNEETIWAGTRVDDINPSAKANLKQIQHLLLEEKNKAAYELTKKHLLGTPPEIRSYEPLGDLFISWKDSAAEVSEYRRSLDLRTAVHTSQFSRKGRKFIQEVFFSAPADIMVVRLSSLTGIIDVAIGLNREKDASITVTGNRLIMKGQIRDEENPKKRGPAGDHLRFTAVADISQSGGNIRPGEKTIEVTGAREVVIRFTAASDYSLNDLDSDPRIDPEKVTMGILQKSISKPWSVLLNEHLKEYQPLFNSLQFELTGISRPDLPTDKRLAAFKSGAEDKGLFPLYFQYGRYLLLSSSRFPAKLPANLQGKWNPHFEAPWQSDYHTNINLQMNYWPLDVANVSVTVKPLAGFMNAMLDPGRHCADSMYGSKGWVMHHVTDIYGRTAINTDPIWGTSPLAGAWMALSLYDHYDFTRDREYLMNYAFPLMKESADFISGFLIEDKHGQLVTAPSMSPENGFYLNKDSSYRNVITYAPAIDIQIINELFNALRATAPVTGLPASYLERMEATQKKLPPVMINRYGGIQEWIQDYDEQEPGHRHMSQLFGLYPGTTLTRDQKLLNASKVTIEHRLKNGGGHTGWSRAWMISFFARLKDGPGAYNHIEQLLIKSTLPNLFDDHPPFQIDGNFGGTAGMAEMLIQSHNDRVELLPALPTAEWPEGKISGLKARGGFIIDLEWKNGSLHKSSVKSTTGLPLVIVYKGREQKLSPAKGETVDLAW